MLDFSKPIRHHPRMIHVGYGPSPEETRRMIKKMDVWAKAVLAKPGAARKFLIKHGFMTKGGKLTKRYGG